MLTTQTVVMSVVGAAVVNAVVVGALCVMRYRREKALDPEHVEHHLDVLITVIEHTRDTVGLG